MRKEVSTPMMAVIVVIFVAVVAALGWYMINRSSTKPLTDADLSKMGSAQVGGNSGGSGEPGKPVKAVY
jgi:hypothetical protein